VIGLLGLLYRKNLIESPNFQRADPQKHNLNSLLKQYPRQLLAGVFVGGFASVAFTTALLFINPVLMTKGFMTKQQLMSVQMILTLLAIITLLIAGQLADKKSAIKVMKYGCLALIFLSYPLLFWIDQGNLIGIVIAQAALVIINQMLLGPSNAYLKNLFIMQYRYRASSLSYCLGVSLFSCLTPIIENYIYQVTGHFSASSLWLGFIGLGTWLSIRWAARDTANKMEKLSNEYSLNA
jgi:MHS family proline/betaine transporter-like MFS transporter